MAKRILRGLGIAALVVAYPLLAHYTNQFSHSDKLSALVAVTPVILVALVLSWRSSRRTIMLSALILVCVILWIGWSALEHHYGLVFWLENTGMQLIFFTMFGRTLIAGRKPLCTHFAEAVHAPLTPQHEIYARQVTIAWTLFFAAMALTSTLLFFLTPLTTWSVFANLLTLPLVAMMFIAEYWVRKKALPDLDQTHILDALRAFRNTPIHPR